MSLTVVTALTDVARQRIAQSILTGKSFSVTDFSVNSAGHDPGNPTLALTPDPAAVVCPGGTPLFGPEPIDSKTLISSFCPQFTCNLELTEAVGSISNICLIATVVFSPTPGDPDIGTTFLFSVGNFPLRVKTAADTLAIIALVQF